jgi:hypothetical protein
MRSLFSQNTYFVGTDRMNKHKNVFYSIGIEINKFHTKELRVEHYL